MRLMLISPAYKKEYDIAWIEFDTIVGNFVIQPGHAPTLLQLSPGTTATCLLKNGKQETLTISGGVAHITRHHVTLLLTV